MYTTAEIANLLGDAEVDKRVYTEQEIFDLEMERVFAHAWTYVGHESQAANPGDFFTTEIGTEPLLVTRDEASQIHVLYNRCSHRGAKLTTDHSGHTNRITCNFHAYSFNLNGTIAGIPLENTYEESNFGRCNPAMNLRSVAEVEIYRGFIFARLKSGNIDLKTWLSDSIATLDNFVDRAPEGEVEVVGKPYRWINNCNWKMLVENLVDGAHVFGTHPSTAQTGVKIAREYEAANKPIPTVLEMAKGFSAPAQFIRDMGVTVLPNGHSYNGGKVSLHSGYSEVKEYSTALQNAHGEERAKEILSQQRHNTCIYPNLHMKTMIQKIRVFKPIAPNKTIVECWAFRLKGAPEEILQRTLSYAEILDSPANLVSTDDAEVMSRMQQGLKSSSNQTVSMHRGQNRPTEKDGVSLHCEGDSELAFVEQYETWKKLMCKEGV